MFNILNWGKVSANINPGLNALWSYNAFTANETATDPEAAGDTIADVLASGYFSARLALVNVGDLIMVYATDGNAILLITEADTVVNTELWVQPSTIGTVFAGRITWSGSGASLATTVTGLLSTDIVVGTLHAHGTQGTTYLQLVPTTDTLTATISTANTSNDLVFDYIVVRPG